MSGTIPSEISKERDLILLLGSNIHPEFHLQAALKEISKKYVITRKSSVWESLPVGSPGGNYLNQAVEIRSDQPTQQIHYQDMRDIETNLGRVRGPDKFDPRTIDIDVILDNLEVLDDKLWNYAFICVPVSELVPDLIDPQTGQTLDSISTELQRSTWIQKWNASFTPKLDM